jgi:CRP-like cAMP-binding protein
MAVRVFEKFLKSLIPINDEALMEISQRANTRRVQAKTTLFRPGKPFNKLLFLGSGLLRAYRIIDGKDVTFFFFAPGEFAVDYESFLAESNSTLYFESVFDSEYVEFQKCDILEFYQKFHEFERIGRLMAENAYLSATRRLKDFQAEPLEERYVKLLKRNPELFQLVHQYHIASYLGVSPQSLSRITSALLKKNSDI